MVSPKRWLSILSVNSLMLFNVSFPLLILPSIVNGAEVIAQTDKSAEAERLLRQGYELLKQGTAESKKQAIEISEKALQLYREAGNKTWEALTLLGIGRVYSDLGEKQKALDYFNQSLTLWQEVKDQTGEARTLTDIGGIYDDLGEKQTALNYYNQSLPLLQQVRDQTGEARTLTDIGRVYNDLGEKQTALNYFNQSLPLWRQVGNKSREAATLYNIGGIYDDLGEKQKALDYFNQSLPLWQEVRYQTGEARTLTDIGGIYNDLGEKQKALDYFNQSLPLWRQLGNKSREARTLTDIGRVYNDLGEKQTALNYYNQSLPLWRQLGNKSREAATLNNIGRVYNDLGEKQTALNYYNQSLPLSRQVGNKSGVAITLYNIGAVYNDLGEKQKALDYYNQSLPLSRQVGNKTREAGVLNNIGTVYNDLGEKQKALDYFNQSLPLWQEVGDKSGVATTINNIGGIYNDLGEKQKALNYYNQSLPLLQQVGDKSVEAATLNNIGRVYNDLGEKQKALDYYNQSLTLSQQLGNKAGEAIILYNFALLKRSQGNLTAALTDMELSINIIEQLRSKIVAQDLRTSYFATVQDYYQFYIDLLMQLHKQNPNKGYDRKALTASERSRARSLLDILAESGADIKTGVDPQLLAQEKQLLQKLNTLDQARQLNTPGYNPDQLKQQIETLSNQLQQLEVKIKQNSPRYANLKYPDPLTASEIQQQVIDKDTILLQYSLGEDRSYLWLVTPTEISSYELPPRTEIEELAKQFREEITSLSPVPETGNKLSKILLSPVANKLENKRLLIVGDGILQTIPFAALPLPQNLNQTNYQPLIVNHEIVSLPSASSISILREQVKGRTPAPKKVAVFADPVFADNDPRFQTTSQTKKETETKDLIAMALTRSLEDFLGLSFSRLEGTRQEAEAILALVPDNLEQLSLDFDANRESAINPNLSQYQIVHLATHGLLNETQPELSGLVLSLYDKTGKGKPGFLQLNDIFNLEMPAELVVLSACETGVGEEIRGEGLVSLTRGFMYAGAKIVVVSLWSVADNSTAQLMENYYQKILETGKNPVESMRETQLEMLNSSNWKAPYYWAAFVVQGEWNE
ncbi:MAG: CHAT domain-containing protein [Okeania sp. SIO2G4]|nr:CHAT domain-containing protein [Okeania sp. SIO2G5]NEP93127.1 CHAT domain-containing protein [Okeania sp. SIO2F5]NEQ93232.1 CHAT domain-containing protein [Okeania sp. SIO2G4]